MPPRLISPDLPFRFSPADAESSARKEKIPEFVDDEDDEGEKKSPAPVSRSSLFKTKGCRREEGILILFVVV